MAVIILSKGHITEKRADHSLRDEQLGRLKRNFPAVPSLRPRRGFADLAKCFQLICPIAKTQFVGSDIVE